MLSEATNRVQRHLKALENNETFYLSIVTENENGIPSGGGIIYSISLGQTTDNALRPDLLTLTLYKRCLGFFKYF